jgi:methylase of polypeptide subunit release factors
VNYPSIRIEGGILSPDIFERLEDLPGQRPTDFDPESTAKVKDEIARAWADAQDYWRIFQRKLDSLKPDSSATTETRQQWMVPLLGLLGYKLEQHTKGTQLNEKNYPISHRATLRASAPVHIVGYREPSGLDRKPERSNLRMSAHAVVQEYLNLSEQLYGLVTNGRVLRLLRDSSRLIKLSYIEFDLDRIFTDGLFADFAILYRLIHASRLPITNDTATESLIERYHQDSLDSGARIRDGLSRAVEQAIRDFANGFLVNPKNAALVEDIKAQRLNAEDFYKQLLRLIYRLLFLMVIEERDLVFPTTASAKHRDIYRQFYSLQRLRSLSEKRYLADPRRHDLWLALLANFRLFEADGPGNKLGLAPLAGDLFRDDAIGRLAACTLGNDVLLKCLRSLNVYEHPDTRQLIRVNYAALNVEEFGSVYEGLLEYEPEFLIDGSRVEFGFKAGDERAATGSHYTPDELVQPLIKHSLDYLIADRLKDKDPEAALLDLRVADIACGSGHILLAAARRIATELAVVRTGEEQPSPTAYRAALRDVIRTCIYGVDLNPLAVELCKVALWLEAHNPGQPLNFLDHHIKCGNAIVGFVSHDEVNTGVPNEALATLPGDDKDTAAEFRKRNREQRRANTATLKFSDEVTKHLAEILDRWKSLSALPEKTPADIEAKKKEFNAFTTGKNAYLLNQIAAIPIAQFYLPKTPENAAKIITDEQFRRYWSGSQTPQGQGVAAALTIAHRKRFFHWFLEFPEVMAKGGFDCILGNPPYLGGNRIANRYGKPVAEHLKALYQIDGNSDLVVYFLNRAFSLLSEKGAMAVIGSQSIKEGTSRSDGLQRFLDVGAVIGYARTNQRWPGRAATNVDLVALHRRARPLIATLDDREVARINSYLEAGVEEPEPIPLRAPQNRSYVGVALHGDGFVLDPATARQLIATDSANSKVVRPFLIGDDLNSHPRLEASRWVIDFTRFGEHDASVFEAPFAIVRQHVYPERAHNNRPVRKKYWWQFGEKSIGLAAAVVALPRYLVTGKTAKHLNFVFLTTHAPVLDQSLTVLAFAEAEYFAIVQSTIHEVWARRYSSNQGGTPRYNGTTALLNFPFPDSDRYHANAVLIGLAERYHDHRQSVMTALWLGLTEIYNLFHARDLSSAKVVKVSNKSAAEAERGYQGLLQLRRLHIELDQAVLHAYGWDAGGANNAAAGPINLAHDFYEVETLPENDRVRYTISPAARKEVLKRLLALNHERAKAEAAANPTKGKKKRVKDEEDESPPALFGGEEA